MKDVRDLLVGEFALRHGFAPTGIWSAPGRVNLIGEHTDYNEGFVLPFAIDKRTWAALAPRDDGMARVSSTFSPEVVEIPVADLAPELLHGWSAYPLGVAWALGAQHGFSLHIHSDVPVGAGLSSSAAIECAAAVALNETWSLGLAEPALARIGQIAENTVVGAPTGIMDQFASMLGRTDSAVFLDCRSLEGRTVPLGLAAAGLEILVIDTRVSHDHATGGYADRRASCELAAATMGVSSLRDLAAADLPRMAEALDETTFRRARHIVTENDRVEETVRLLAVEGPRAIGALLDASHVSMRDDFEISVPQLDLAVATAQAAGAIGARMTGGGFGGAAIALIPVESRPAIEAAVLFAFDNRGYAVPDLFTVQPSEGATMKGDLHV